MAWWIPVMLALIIVAALIFLGIIVTQVLQEAARCGGDLLRDCAR